MGKVIVIVFGVTVILYYIYGIIVLPKVRHRKIVEQQNKMEEFQNQLKVSDNVLTMAGIYGSIVGMNKNIVSLEIAPKTIVKVDKTSIVATTKNIH
ncbi:preprotein translocase subunit YajC [Clostridium botulinum]|uniref:Preprotein translocase subunit YajC n=1 Tax=Clostridium botulinum TaxID=1491 RepID=A0A9Q1UZE4_CLOBO|nr:preprotein translocase subunit YajC [Clostridium botulinum]AEB75456.1 putative preprotein translocase [Clostridium botulinum BKT015925]KEH99671.1 preprotein translocase subunit YajC [Clostridium botulinum D str. 16868]KEI02872.1 preprotein translocase subunit YajC [Clostridium botulinum C/D str. Sp77]KLU74824.1 preprotein translocase subunit YajC [Clostridium botulinum V891]KOA74675.1 preprotein translocase subunit YajC [Clostridium botulinum]